VPYSRLNFGVKPAGLAWGRIPADLRLYIFHDLFHAPPRVKLQQFSFKLKPLLPYLRAINAIASEKFRELGNFSGDWA
jgi:hypothetical protein